MRYVGGLLGLAVLVCAMPIVLATHDNATNMTEDFDDENVSEQTGSVISAIDALRTQNETVMNRTETETSTGSAGEGDGEGGVIYVVLMEEEIRPAQESEIPEINEWLEDIGSTVPDEDEIIIPDNATTAFTGFGDDTFVTSNDNTFDDDNVFDDNRSGVLDDGNDSGFFDDEEDNPGFFDDENDTVVGGIY